MRSCLQCPGPDMTSAPGSKSVLDCKCRDGYTWEDGHCRMLDCPVLQPPSNGYFIRNECRNVFNAACGVRCNSGYQVLFTPVPC